MRKKLVAGNPVNLKLIDLKLIDLKAVIINLEDENFKLKEILEKNKKGNCSKGVFYRMVAVADVEFVALCTYLIYISYEVGADKM